MDLEKIREEFIKDKFASCQAGAVVDDAGEDFSRCSMEIKPHHLNGIGRVMGGAVFTLADFAIAVLSNSGGRKTVSLSSNISFLGAAKGKRLIAEAKCIKNGKTICAYEAEVKDELGTLVALVTAESFVLNN